MLELENIIHQYRAKEITLKEAADRVIEIVYKNPCYFGFDRLHSDQKSELILFVYARLKQIIQTYDPSKSLFRTFLVNAINIIRKSYYKSFFKDAAHRKACQQYAQEEFITDVAEDEPEYVYGTKKINTKNMPDNVRVYLTSCLPKIPDSTKIMMLALKSEHFIKPQHIHKLHKVTGIKETEILDMFQRLRNTLDKRKMNYIHHKELQNKAYILMKRTSFMLDNIKDKTKLYDSLKSATHFHNETWKRHTEILKSLHTIVPTNGDVSKILGLSDPQIRRLQSFIEGFERTVRKRHKRKEKS